MAQILYPHMDISMDISMDIHIHGKPGFRGWAIECWQSNFTPTDSRCNGNEIWTKWEQNGL